MIYFMQPSDGGAIKIGYTVNDVDSRRKQLEPYYKQPLAILATIPGGRDKEREIHELFAEHRLGRTEQFRPAPEIMAFIGRPLLVDPNPAAVEMMSPNGKNISYRVSGEYGDWLERLAKRHRTTVAGVMDRAIVEWAQSQGFDVPPPERMP
jgi:hypothetical protein